MVLPCIKNNLAGHFAGLGGIQQKNNRIRGKIDPTKDFDYGHSEARFWIIGY